MAKRFLDENGLDALWGLIKAAVNTLLEKMDGKADVKHTHLYVGIEDHASMSFDNENVYIRDAEYTPVIKVLNPEGNACGVQISSNLNEHWQLGIEDDGSYLQSPNGINMVVVQDDALRLKHLGTDTTGGTDVNLQLDMTNNIIEIKQPGKSGSAFKAKTDETSVKFNDSMGLCLKADQSELKFRRKGLTLTGTDSKLTATNTIRLLAPEVSIGQADNKATLNLNGSDLGGTVERLSVQPHVELLCMDKRLFLVADKGYIKETDSVTFFRYIRSHNLYRMIDSSDKLKIKKIHRRVIGWKHPKGNSEVGEIKLILLAVPTSVAFKYFDNKDLFMVGRNVNSGQTIGKKFEDIITIFKALEVNKEISADGDRTDRNFLLFNKKCGIRIKRGQEWITDYLPFMARKDRTNVKGEFSYGIGRWV